jgi:hypothetical protein
MVNGSFRAPFTYGHRWLAWLAFVGLAACSGGSATRVAPATSHAAAPQAKIAAKIAITIPRASGAGAAGRW